MRLRDILWPLCVSLSQCDWREGPLQHHLADRLPRRLSRLALALARELQQAFPKATTPDPETLWRLLRHSDAAERIFAHAVRTGTLPAKVLTTPLFRPDPALAHLPLPALDTLPALAEWLALTDMQLIRFSDPHGLSALGGSHFATHYITHTIPKSDGRLRLIEEPKPLLKRLQRRILHGILDHVPPDDAAFGFRQGRNCITAAARHAGEALVLCFDLADFFPSVPFLRLFALFRSPGYPRAVALALTNLCTAITPPAQLRGPGLAAVDALSNRHLPQGAPTSPALANICALGLDKRLGGLARRLGARYTRYADDLTFSGDASIAPILLRAVPEIARDAGFRVNAAKTRKMQQGQRQTVTGITVNQHTNIRRTDFDRLKATIHHLADPADHRLRDPAFLSRLSGQIVWVEQVNPPRGYRLRLSLIQALSMSSHHS